MNLNKLEIKNFYSYREAEFTFNYTAPVLVIGEKAAPGVDSNGAGKSSLFEAVTWAIFGTTTTGISGDNVVNRGVGKDCLVTLTGSIKGKEFKILRARKHSLYKNELKFYMDGQECSGKNNTDTQNKIEKILNVNLEFYKQTTFFNPRNMQPFCALTDAKQKSLLESLLDISKLDGVKDTLLKKMNNLTVEKAKLDVSISVLEREKAVSITNLLKQLENYREIQNTGVLFACESVERLLKERTELGSPQVDSAAYALIAAEQQALLAKKRKVDQMMASLKNKACVLCKQPLIPPGIGGLTPESIDKISNSLTEKLKKIDRYVKTHILNTENLRKINDLDSQIEANKAFLKNYATIENAAKIAFYEQKAEVTKAILGLKNQYHIRDSIVKKLELLSQTSKLFGARGIKGYLVATLLDTVNDCLKRHINALCPNEGVSLLFNTEKNVLEIVMKNGRTYESCSSGEAKRIDISILFAFLETMSKLNIKSNFIILDEVFDALDESGLDKLLELLYTINTTNLFVITHNNSLKSYFNEVIVIKNVNDESTICSQSQGLLP